MALGDSDEDDSRSQGTASAVRHVDDDVDMAEDDREPLERFLDMLYEKRCRDLFLDF